MSCAEQLNYGSCAPFVMQSQVKYYPYQSWIVNPVTENKAILTLDTHGNIIRIEVGSGLCKLLETPFVECNHIIGEELEPILLLQVCRYR